MTRRVLRSRLRSIREPSAGHRRAGLVKTMRIERCLGIWTLAALLGASSPLLALGPESLFAPRSQGDGQRVDWRIINPAESGKSPWTAVGNFLIPGVGGYCSAVLVAPRVVLTANHCLYAADHRTLDARGVPTRQLMEAINFVFVAGVHDDIFADRVAVVEVITGGWTPSNNQTARDWAIAILERPVSASVVPATLSPYSLAEVAGWTNKLILAAYPGGSFDYDTALRLSFDCSILASVSTTVMTTTCRSDSGSSGGPVFVNEDGKLRLVSILSGRLLGATTSRGASINGFRAQIGAAIARFAPSSPRAVSADASSFR